MKVIQPNFYIWNKRLRTVTAIVAQKRQKHKRNAHANIKIPNNAYVLTVA